MPVETDATIIIGEAVGEAGTTVTVERVATATDRIQVAGTQNDITFDAERSSSPETTIPPGIVNPEINKPATTFAFQPPGCTPGTDCTGVRALVLALANVVPIPNGSVLYTCQIAIADDAADGTYPLTCTNAGASDPVGGIVATSCVDGEVVVGVQPTATSTATSSVHRYADADADRRQRRHPDGTHTAGTPTPPTVTGTPTRTATNTRAPSSTTTTAAKSSATPRRAAPPGC